MGAATVVRTGGTGEQPRPPEQRVDHLATWILESARGDHEAFARLYDATARRAYGVALHVLQDRARAEEVVQEAFLQVWHRSACFDPSRGSARSWIMTIVHHGAVSRVRAVQRRRRREDAFHHRHDDRAGHEDETFETVHRRRDIAIVRGALLCLTPMQRAAIELAYFDGLTYTEVATRLGIPAGTAKTRIRDGLRRMRMRLTAEGDPEE